MMIGVYWGRFNPPHKGHMAVIKKLLLLVDRLIIAIGSSEFKNTKRNPFSGTERTSMIRAYLKEEGIDRKRVRVIAVPDGNSYRSAIKNLNRLCPKFDVFFLSDEKDTIIRLLRNRAIIRRFKRTGGISSTKIRDAISNNEKWEHLTGKSVVKIIKRKKGIERIRRAYAKY
jgi:nicotinamide-nucleotide adenylyltransferase